MYIYAIISYTCELQRLKVKQHGDFQQHCGNFVSFFNLVSLKDKWNEGFPKFGVVFKDLEVEPVVVKSSQPKETKCEKCKCKCWEGPGGQRIAHPFNDLTKEIGSRNIREQAALWNLIGDFSRLPELAQYIVTVNVDSHPQNK